MDKKNILITIGVICGMVAVLALVDKMTSNPLVECQTYVENWRIEELNKIKKQYESNMEVNKAKLEEIYACDVNGCTSVKEAIAERANYESSRIEIKYNNKLKVCSGQK